MKIAIFGLGKRYLKYEDRIKNDYEVVYICDNDAKKWGWRQNIRIGPIDELCQYDFEFILVTPLHYVDIVEQLRMNHFFKIYLLNEKDPSCFSWETLDCLLDNYEFWTVLDIGCGEGKQAKIFEEHGKKVTAIDKGKSVYFENNKEALKVIIGDFNDVILDCQFDCIWCSHILEHQLNVNQFLRKIHSNLKEEGVLAITVPHLDDVVCSGHVTYWNAGILLYNLVLAGFDCSSARVGTYSYNVSVVLEKKSIVLPELNHDAGDIEKIRSYLPSCIKYTRTSTDLIFNGEMENINWPSPHYTISKIDY